MGTLNTVLFAQNHIGKLAETMLFQSGIPPVEAEISSEGSGVKIGTVPVEERNLASFLPSSKSKAWATHHPQNMHLFL